MSVPKTFFEGDTVSWDETLSSDYPATDWLLTYRFINESGKITVVAQANGDDYIVNLTAAETDTYIAGEYTWVAKVEDIATSSKSYTVLAGQLQIFKNLEDVNQYDARTWAEIALENVEAVIANRASLDQESYSFQGRALSRTPLADLINLRKYLQAEVASQKDLVSDGPSSKTAQVRF
jgi:hypothetical protein